jgi:MFS family permease
MPHPYTRLLADRRLRGLAVGDLLSSAGDGMAMVAIPWQALQLSHLHGVGEGLAVTLAVGANSLVGIPLALGSSLGRRRYDPRAVLLADCALRGVLFVAMAALAAAGRLSLWGFVALLAAGSLLHPLAVSSRRLIATDLAGPDQRLAVNSLLATQASVAMWTVGPALGGLVTGTVGAPAALALDGVSFAPLLLAVLRLPADAGRHGAAASGPERVGALAILRRHPGVAGFLLLTLVVDLLYYPVEVALPIHVQQLLGGAGTLGAVWAGFGAGAIAGSVLAGMLGRLPQRAVLIGAIAGWSLALAAFTSSRGSVPVAAAFALGGLLWAPFSPVAYTLIQGEVGPEEQQPVVTLWTAVLLTSAPLGLAVGGPLVTRLGATSTLWASSVATLTLAALAAAVLVLAPRRTRVS